MAGSIPLICVIELTRRCNLRCAHCYIGSHNTSKGELTTSEIRSVLGGLARAGCLNLIFTGGEIFLRPDLTELCEFARAKGFDLRLFTNGTLIDDKIAEKLAAVGVCGVEISLYGKRRAHDLVTRSPGSFKRSLNAIRSLQKNNIRVTIKSPVMKTNFSDYKWLASFARKHGLKARFDPTVSPRDNGDKSVLKYRLSGRQMTALFRDPAVSGKPALYDGEADFTCSAGRNMAAIGFDGTVYPCLQLLIPVGNVKKMRFSDIWDENNRRLGAFRKLSIKDFPVCAVCALSSHCRRCPGLALLEDKTLTGPSKTACRIAKIERSIAACF